MKTTRQFLELEESESTPHMRSNMRIISLSKGAFPADKPNITDEVLWERFIEIFGEPKQEENAHRCAIHDRFTPRKYVPFQTRFLLGIFNTQLPLNSKIPNKTSNPHR